MLMKCAAQVPQPKAAAPASSQARRERPSALREAKVSVAKQAMEQTSAASTTSGMLCSCVIQVRTVSIRPRPWPFLSPMVLS
jgi:hypothetical protein